MYLGTYADRWERFLGWSKFLKYITRSRWSKNGFKTLGGVFRYSQSTVVSGGFFVSLGTDEGFNLC